MVFGQTNPWALFQQLCPTGRLATGPQCQNLLTGNNIGTGTCPTGSCNFRLAYALPFTNNNTCPTGSVLQNGVRGPFTNNNSCPTGSVFRMADVYLLQHRYRAPSLMLAQSNSYPSSLVLLLHWLVQEVSPPQVVLL